MTPGIPDKKMVFLLTQSYYEQLLEAGVHIYEYQPGSFMQSLSSAMMKSPSLGQSILDYRSLYLHFENGVWFYKNKVIRTSCLTFRKHSITVIRSVLISVGTETLSYGLFRVFFACLHLYSDIHLDEAFLQKQYPPRILTAERYCFMFLRYIFMIVRYNNTKVPDRKIFMRNNKILRKKYLLLPLCFFFLLLHICMISVYAGQENSTSGSRTFCSQRCSYGG